MQIQNLKIALIGPLPPPSGGMANQTRQLARLLMQEGVSVEVVQVNAPYQPTWVGQIKGLRAVFRLVPYFLNLWRAAGRADLFHIMANSGWSWHLFAAPAIWIGKLRDCAVVVNYRGGEADEFFTRAFSVVRPSLKRANVLVVPSGFLEQIFAKRGFTTSIVPNIVDLASFCADVRPREIEPHIIVARNLEPLYDNATAIRAFAIVREEHPRARLTIAGTGPQRRELETLAYALKVGDAVTFVGRVENSDMPALYQTTDVAINSSLVDNMPISVLEALASGVPVVSTDVGGVPFLVMDGKTALLVPARDPAQMANAVLRILSDTSLRQNLVQAGFAHARQFGWESVREKLFSAYACALGERSLAHASDVR